MRTPLTTLLICASCTLTSAAQADTDEFAVTTIDDTVITAVSADPFATSGIFAFAVDFSGVIDGETAKYYIPFMSIGQAKPEVGQTCKVSWQWHDGFDWLTATGNSVQGVRLVSKFSCETERSASE